VAWDLANPGEPLLGRVGYLLNVTNMATSSPQPRLACDTKTQKVLWALRVQMEGVITQEEVVEAIRPTEEGDTHHEEGQ
jgi:hypothetical protein